MPRINVEVLGDSSSLVKAFERARRSAHGFQRDISKSGRGAIAGTGALHGLGRSVAFASASFLGGAGLGFAVKSSISASIELGKQMALLQTQAGATAGEVESMTKAVERLGPAVGFAPEELAKGLFHVESAGFRGAKALTVLRTAAEGAKVGNSDLEQTTTALVAAQQSGIRGTENIKKAMGGLNAIVGAGNMRMEDLTGALSTGILPSARAAGVGLTDVGAALATLTNAGVPAQAAGTRLRMTFSLLGTQTPKAAKALASIGIKSNELGNSLRKKGLVPTLLLLQAHLKASGLSATEQASVISKAFGGGRSASTLITLLQNLDGVSKRQKQIAAGSDKFGAAWVRTQHTAAFATDRLKASVAVLQSTLGAALVPVLVKAAKAMSDWLGKSKNQELIQARLHQAIRLVTAVVHGVVNAFRVMNTVTGNTKNTVKLLVGAMVAFKALNFASSIRTNAGAMLLFQRRATTAGQSIRFISKNKIPTLDMRAAPAFSKIAKLRGALSKLTSAPYLVVFTLVAVGAAKVAANIKKLQETQLAAQNRVAGKGALVPALVPRLAKEITAMKKAGLSGKEILARLRKQLGGSLIGDDVIGKAFLFSAKTPNTVKKQIQKAVAERAKVTKSAAVKAAAATGTPGSAAAAAEAASSKAAALKAAAAQIAAKKAAAALVRRAQRTERRNTIFDAVVDQRLGGVQFINSAKGQLQALKAVSVILSARIAKTKDITRKINLEHKLGDVRNQIKDIKTQQRQDVIAARAAAAGRKKRQHEAAVAVRDAKNAARTARQFRQLGFTGAGDDRTPGARSLRKRLGTLGDAVKGTFLDTSKTRGTLARIGKVLSEGLVPKDVRAKMKEMLDGLNDELKNHAQGNLTKFRHVNSNAVLAGLNLTPEQRRKLRGRIAQVGAGGTLPGTRTAAFASATTVHTHVHLDGRVVAQNTTKHQRKADTRRSGSRRGPYAGHS